MRVDRFVTAAVLVGVCVIAAPAMAADADRVPMTDPGVLASMGFPPDATYVYKLRDAGAPAEVTPDAGARARVVFDEPQRAMTPGQSLVLYDGDRVVAGGVIERVP